MVITLIKKLRGRKDLYTVFFDNGTAVTLSALTIGKFNLVKGNNLSEEETAEVLKFEQQYSAKQCALNYISYRPRSSQEVRTHLFRKGYPANIVDEIIHSLKESKYIDDVQFALLYLQDQRNKRPQGKNMLWKKMLAKGIDPDIVERTLRTTITQEQEIAQAKILISKKLRASLNNKNISTMKRYNKLYQLLRRRGFSPDIIRIVLHNNQLSDNYDSE